MPTNIPAKLEPLKQSGKILASCLSLSKGLLKPGATPLELDLEVHRFILSHKATPSFLGLGGFLHATCISVNNQIVHGVPTSTPLQNGDLVTVDIGVEFEGYCTDAARTFFVGNSRSKLTHGLINAVNTALDDGIRQAVAGNKVGDVSFAIQRRIELGGFRSPLDYGGHGIGTLPHQDPFVSNTGMRGRGETLTPWLCLAIEPIAMAGSIDVFVYADDEFTVYSSDGLPSSHAEDTIIVTDLEPIIVTRETLEGGRI